MNTSWVLIVFLLAGTFGTARDYGATATHIVFTTREACEAAQAQVEAINHTWEAAYPPIQPHLYTVCTENPLREAQQP